MNLPALPTPSPMENIKDIMGSKDLVKKPDFEKENFVFKPERTPLKNRPCVILYSWLKEWVYTFIYEVNFEC